MKHAARLCLDSWFLGKDSANSGAHEAWVSGEAWTSDANISSGKHRSCRIFKSQTQKFHRAISFMHHCSKQV